MTVAKITAWFKKQYGERAGLILLVVLALILVFGIMSVLNKCEQSRHERELGAQTKQGNASAEAIANAAADAVQTVQGRGTVEQQIDAATAQASKEIGNAENSDEIRAAVLRALCGDGMRGNPRNDPACDVR